MVVSPIQTSFAGGELSPRLRGRVDSEVYRRGLQTCENFQVLPQGPLLMRAGSVYVGEEASAPRLFRFRVSDNDQDTILALTPLLLHVYSRNGREAGLGANLITNGDFSAGLTGWTDVGPSTSYVSAGECHLGSELRQAITVEAAKTYRTAFEFRAPNTGPFLQVNVGTTLDGSEVYSGTFGVSKGYLDGGVNEPFSFEFASPGAGTVYVRFVRLGIVIIDDIAVRESGSLIELVTPWTDAQLRDVQFAAEPAKNRAFFVHPNVAPRVLTFTAPSAWDLSAVAFVSPPAEWAGTNWPGVVELFQGRLLLGGTPSQPHDVWGSKTTNPYDFGVSAPVVASDAFHYTLSTKGKMRWMQGRQVLLIGNETVESSAVGADQIITPVSPPDVRDESAFGSAAIQAVDAGDQALFVARDRRSVRAMSYSQEANSWISRAITFLSEHITAGVVRELHFAVSPVPTVLAVLGNGRVVACSYDRGEEVIAWWRLEFGGDVHSVAVAEGPNGSDLWIVVERDSGYLLEYSPLHETGAVYVDSAKIGALAVDGTFAGLAHLEGETVRVIVDGAVEDDQVVTSGVIQAVTAERIADDPTLVGATVVVGLPYTARAKTLPFEGGSPRGTAQGAKRRFTRVGVILNDSALPLVDGKRVPDRTPATPQDEAEPRRTGAFAAAGALGWESEGVITIEQDLPVRTEVLALFGIAAVHER